ncbi:MAG: preprotein translocase subunit SecG [Actinobacteria bacterium]|nr:preprotein translocase subunit SecG [Actinomycetota bacterium]
MLYFVLAIHVLLCLGLIVAILLHNPQGSGLSADFSASFSYSGKTLIERYLDKVTIGLGIAFMLTTAILLFLYK